MIFRGISSRVYNNPRNDHSGWLVIFKCHFDKKNRGIETIIRRGFPIDGTIIREIIVPIDCNFQASLRWEKTYFTKRSNDCTFYPCIEPTIQRVPLLRCATIHDVIPPVGNYEHFGVRSDSSRKTLLKFQKGYPDLCQRASSISASK